MTDDRGARRRRANGEESRRKILDATVEVAGERGYEGTSIALVSKKCGLPASSIYWHFKDKDELIAAVIERSFDSWLSALTLPGEEHGQPVERVTEMSRQVAKSLLETPEFLRLGLMLTLERRPEEPSARTMFLQVRHIAAQRITAVIGDFLPDLDDDSVRLLATYAMAGADGLFIAKEIGGDSVDLLRLFELHAHVLFAAAAHLSAGAPPPPGLLSP
ncbi:TetR family transcriptional regulator [Amycolatopsis sp. NBRC 101858]|uniref:TetR/AcrR family transcriptional regulator n=1 Tax=Amycolatopsis sp. NBRC 101858 TaxID=3032200 RepID=UPI00249FF4BB|nr:TetR/AcrR family transcriptional regulator [Amycolatopsis sp. NBRC 101858]GLY38237.1 TetR family transcriptional regulator [Amycolatopsis sp. NBRC 101858]